jgi:hypothetical protein
MREKRVSLTEVRSELSAWRRLHGGRGKPIPQPFWDKAITLALRDGVGETARALGLSEARLERLTHGSASSSGEPSVRFIELDAAQVLPPSGQVTLERLGRDGERLRLHLTAPSTEQLVALVRAFAGRTS